MPWDVKEYNGRYCVFKKGTSKPIKGGCHDTKADATRHQRALYSNVEGAARIDEITAEILARVSQPERKDDGASLVAIADVPIVSTGIEYPLASGPTTFTEGDLRDAVEAAETDPHIRHPRLKLAYDSPHGQAITEPAFGKAENLRLGDNNQTIYGDYVGVPEWLADILPTAYPSRSIEGSWDVETAGGKKYRMVINSVALLGVHMPGCTSLEDLKGLFGSKQPSGVEIRAERGGIVAAVDVEDVRRAFYDQLSPDKLMWWVRGMRLNPNQLIVDGGDGKLYRVPFSVDNRSNDKVKFDDPVAVDIEYVDKPANQQDQIKLAASVVAGMAIAASNDGREMTVFASRQEAGRDVNTTQEGGEFLDRKELATKLGLSEDATDEQINEALDRATAAVRPGTPTPESGQAGSGTPPMEDTTGHTGPTPESSTNDPPANTGGAVTTPPADTSHPADDDPDARTPEIEGGFVKLDAQQYRDLVQGARAARNIAATSAANERNDIVASAIKEGKIPPARKDHYLKLMESDPAGTKQLLAELAPGLVPVLPAGHGGGNGATEVTAEALPEDWFPGVNFNQARERAGKGWPRVTNAAEG